MKSHDGKGKASKKAAYDFIISRNTKDDRYAVWRFDPTADNPFEKRALDPDARFNRKHKLAAIGDYVLEWGPLHLDSYCPCYPYRLLKFDPSSPDPLSATAHLKGLWTKEKFWGSRSKYSWNEHEDEYPQLIPLASFVLHYIPAKKRGTFGLWNFDPQPNRTGNADPLPARYAAENTAPWLMEAFSAIRGYHELLPFGNYVLDRLPDKKGYRLWSFDPQRDVPLVQPVVRDGRWSTIDEHHRLVPVGEHLLDWLPRDGSYRIWRFDPQAPDPLTGPVYEGQLPEEFGVQTTLFGLQPRIPVNVTLRDTPGTIDFMRDKIKHVVYYMLESRSFDNVCGWLYEKGEKDIQFVGSDAPFKGASTKFFNTDGKRKIHLSQYKSGKLSEDWELSALKHDPFHGYADNMCQMFSDEKQSYKERAIPDMGGFVLNTVNEDVMKTFSPEQLPVINGLAKRFGVSDEWFCSVPGGTAMNRAFSVTGSSFGRLTDWEGGNIYNCWADTPHRQSIWKVLWSNGITDWKIYNSVLWLDFRYTYHLYLEGQIPTIDAHPTNFLADMTQFKRDANDGKLPAFSYLEPVWIAPTGTTSYHPDGDLVLGERALNEIYDALRTGPVWEQTLLIITFDKSGGIYDHVPPSYAHNPWPNDANDGFHFDLMGPRVPTIVVSPWIKEKTVFRANGEIPFDSTSFLSTLLNWFGIPRARWGLGDRVHHAPTFEGIFLETEARRDAPKLTPPYDKKFPPVNRQNSR